MGWIKDLASGATSGTVGAVVEGIKVIASPVTEHFRNKAALNKAVTDAQIDRIKTGQMSDAEIDRIERAKNSWMDDVSFALFLSPAVLAFYPPALPHILNGFAAIEKMPKEWQIAVGLMLAAVWGYRRIITPIAEVIISNSILGRKK